MGSLFSAAHEPNSYISTVRRILPLSSKAARAVEHGRKHPDQGPDSWLQVSDLLTIRHNSKLLKRAKRWFEGLVPFLNDEDSLEEVTTTSANFDDNHKSLNWSLVLAMIEVCFDKICHARFSVYRAETARRYAEEVLLTEDMAEVMDAPLADILEGQFLHGSGFQGDGRSADQRV